MSIKEFDLPWNQMKRRLLHEVVVTQCFQLLPGCPSDQLKVILPPPGDDPIKMGHGTASPAGLIISVDRNRYSGVQSHG
jgi:hypothetical protein